MIAARDLRAGYAGTDVLRQVSIEVRQGEMVGVLGPNGSGKTTLLLTLAGIIRPSSGEVSAGGRDLKDISPRERARLMAVLPQTTAMTFAVNVTSLVLMGRFAHAPVLAGYATSDLEAARAALDDVGASHLADRTSAQLSGGELKRVLIARALAQQTPYLLLDEAAAGLDPAKALEIHDLLAEKCARGAGVLLTIHDLNLAALYCHRLIFLKDGRVAAQGPTRDIFTRETIKDIYATDPVMAEHPLAGTRQALFVPGRSRRA